jgi:hypothetical protein
MPKSTKKPSKCNHCCREYLPIRVKQKFCSRECKQLSQQEQRKNERQNRKIKTRSSLFFDSSFSDYLVDQCKRAKTVQILQGLIVEDLEELKLIKANCVKANGMKDGNLNDTFEISHIEPVVQADLVGTLHPKNLVISTKTYNRRRSNKLPSKPTIHKIDKKLLNADFAVSKSDTKAVVLDKIKTLLGSVITEFTLQSKLIRSTRVTTIRKLKKLNIAFDPKSKLEDLLALLPNKKASGFEAYPPILIMLLELERHGHKNHIITACIDLLLKSRDRCVLQNQNDLTRFLLEQAESVLHLENSRVFYKGVPLICLFTPCLDSGFDNIDSFTVNYYRTPEEFIKPMESLVAALVKESCKVDF